MRRLGSDPTIAQAIGPRRALAGRVWIFRPLTKPTGGLGSPLGVGRFTPLCVGRQALARPLAEGLGFAIGVHGLLRGAARFAEGRQVQPLRCSQPFSNVLPPPRRSAAVAVRVASTNRWKWPIVTSVRWR